MSLEPGFVDRVARMAAEQLVDRDLAFLACDVQTDARVGAVAEREAARCAAAHVVDIRLGELALVAVGRRVQQQHGPPLLEGFAVDLEIVD